MEDRNRPPKQLILLHFNDLVINKPLIFSPFKLFDKTVKSELNPTVSDTIPAEKTPSQLERI